MRVQSPRQTEFRLARSVPESETGLVAQEPTSQFVIAHQSPNMKRALCKFNSVVRQSSSPNTPTAYTKVD